MKAKSFLFGLLASAAFVSCSNEVDSIENNVVNQKGEQSYLAVNLNPVTRTTPTFEAGSDAENLVNNVSFFFFDADGNAYDVTGEGSNRLDKTYSNPKDQEFTGDVNVEEISTPILLIEESQQVPPQKIVAVLNCPISNTNISLSALQSQVGTYNTITVGEGDAATTYFVMSNSAYMNAVTGEEVVATDIPALSISHDAETALANPVTIYVERVAAKVAVTSGQESFATGVKTSNGGDIYAVVEGWELTNIKSEARLLKKINTAWNSDVLGFVWNNAANYRSYWADTETGGGVTHPWSWNTITNDASRYYYENTGDDKTQLLVKAYFVDADGNELKGDNAVAEWYGAKYTFADLKEQFANAVATQIYVKTGDKTAESIEPEHITFYQESDQASEQRYLCYATLDSETTEDLVFVSGVDEDGEFVTMTVDEVNEILAGIRPAKIWEAGGYYYMNVDHMGETAEGLVRNHVYEIYVNSITGLGTPVYDPAMIIKPEPPTGDASYISAEIKVLSWAVVSYDVDLQ